MKMCILVKICGQMAFLDKKIEAETKIKLYE